MRQRYSWAAGAVGAVLIFLAVTLIGASEGGASPSRANPDPSTTCTLTGKRYVGTTSQKKRLCFTLTADGKRLREYAFDYRNTCGGGSLRTTIRGGLPLSANGSFSTTGQGFFKGTVRGSAASGTARSMQQTYILGQFETCDTGLVRWSARKASG
jgi:hypothetical protein